MLNFLGKSAMINLGVGYNQEVSYESNEYSQLEQMC
jgi:hypothetical protein